MFMRDLGSSAAPRRAVQFKKDVRIRNFVNKTMKTKGKSGYADAVVVTGSSLSASSEGDQFAANRGEVQPPHTQGHDQSATLPLLAST